ncbi:MAG: AAR2 protein [Candidatus Lokiarchaeum sp. GC14_75]|nr:MAG: AAR2 protein [Candidatus Lokiarchaeum sp. GC14_75]
MFGYIILRDIPKKLVQLDMLYFPIRGGFRGFREVNPGPHYVNIEVNNDMHKGFWCWVEPGEAIIKVYDYEKNIFKNDEPKNESHFKKLALSGAMNHVLIPVTLNNFKSVSFWKKLTKNISSKSFPPILHSEVPMTLPLDINPDDVSDWYINKFKSRFEQAFNDSHKNNIQAFLGEFEYAFLKYIVRQSDKNALERWMDLIQAVYNAGERSVELSPDLFINFVYVVQYQFDLLKKEDLQPNTKLLAGVEKIIEDMRDVGTDKLIKHAQDFENYLLNRGIKI